MFLVTSIKTRMSMMLLATSTNGSQVCQLVACSGCESYHDDQNHNILDHKFDQYDQESDQDVFVVVVCLWGGKQQIGSAQEDDRNWRWR